MSKTTATTFEELTQHAEQIRNDQSHDLRGAMEVGDGWPQGDVLIRRIGRVPAGAKKAVTRLQLAPGETQGSRHCLSSGEGITMYDLADASPLEGPVFEAAQEVSVTHPEHGDVTLSPGIYAIEYQRTGEALNSMRRVRD
jgi:hypothetical protein